MRNLDTERIEGFGGRAHEVGRFEISIVITVLVEFIVAELCLPIDQDSSCDAARKWFGTYGIWSMAMLSRLNLIGE